MILDSLGLPAKVFVSSSVVFLNPLSFASKGIDLVFQFLFLVFCILIVDR